MEIPVVIAGAGPVGLWLAAELRLADVPVLVLERRTERDPHSKALTIHPRTIEILASRGLEKPFLAEGLRIPSGHFAVLDDRLDFGLLDTDFPYTVALPQVRTEELIEDHVRASGAEVRRGHTVTGLTEHPGGVTVRVDGPDGSYLVEAQYVVGCDGTSSTVRKVAGIAYPGTDSTVVGWLGDVRLDNPPDRPAFSVASPEGLLMIVALPDGYHRMVGNTPHDVRTDWPGEFTLDELRENTVAIAGTDFGMHSPFWLSRYTNASRQAERYRQGRVLLAGDAAHQHMPAGGVGLNAGVQDAMNLGWKLADVVSGHAPEALLDTYHDERHPVGERLLAHTQAQTALMTALTPDGRQLRALLSSMVAAGGGFARTLAERLSGLDVSYAAEPGAHPLAGTRAPNLRLSESTLFEQLHAGRHILLDLRRDRTPPLADAVAGGPPQDRPAWADVSAALIRPDGHVAWATVDADPAPPAPANRISG